MESVICTKWHTPVLIPNAFTRNCFWKIDSSFQFLHSFTLFNLLSNLNENFWNSMKMLKWVPARLYISIPGLTASGGNACSIWALVCNSRHLGPFIFNDYCHSWLETIYVFNVGQDAEPQNTDWSCVFGVWLWLFMNPGWLLCPQTWNVMGERAKDD